MAAETVESRARPAYEPPRLVRLAAPSEGHGDCAPSGSGDSVDCSDGFAAPTSCGKSGASPGGAGSAAGTGFQT